MKGFSLVEVLIFTAILAIFFVVASEVTTASLRNMKISEHKIIATRYAEELESWLQSQRETNWNNFVAKSSGPGTYYCFKNDISSGWPASGDCGATDYTAVVGRTPAIFKRNVKLVNVGGSGLQVDVTVNVSWQEVGGTVPNPVQIQTRYSVWEQ